jgi:PIN domain nuclease of toxin-antitoxin system
MNTILLDTHVLHWWSAEPAKLSKAALQVMDDADEFAVAAVSWFELAWLARHDRIAVAVPVRAWLDRLSAGVRTVGIGPAIADTAAALPSSFPGDQADRLIYATAIERGWRLITKDRRMRRHASAESVAVW